MSNIKHPTFFWPKLSCVGWRIAQTYPTAIKHVAKCCDADCIMRGGHFDCASENVGRYWMISLLNRVKLHYPTPFIYHHSILSNKFDRCNCFQKNTTCCVKQYQWIMFDKYLHFKCTSLKWLYTEVSELLKIIPWCQELLARFCKVKQRCTSICVYID